jgi:hypothetical protein
VRLAKPAGAGRDARSLPASPPRRLLPKGEGVRRTDEGEERLANQRIPNRRSAPPSAFSLSVPAFRLPLFPRVHPWLKNSVFRFVLFRLYISQVHDSLASVFDKTVIMRLAAQTAGWERPVPTGWRWRPDLPRRSAAKAGEKQRRKQSTGVVSALPHSTLVWFVLRPSSIRAHPAISGHRTNSYIVYRQFPESHQVGPSRTFEILNLT